MDNKLRPVYTIPVNIKAGVFIMAQKEQRENKNVKKEPKKSLKEKRKEKQEKQAARTW